MHETIQQSLIHLEKELGIRVLYACESGSRAWGFASQDSDWDVRFFYVRPEQDYLRVHTPADQLHRDLPGDLDITGWDLRKALHHTAKSSASVLEWLGSPLVYLEGAETGELRHLAQECFRVRPTVHHYLGLAKQLWSQAGEGEALNGKKVLYVMRATLAARWTLTYGTPPPVAFAEMLPLIGDATLTEEILRFVDQKQQGLESDAFPVSPALRGYLERTRADGEAESSALAAADVEMDPLDRFFRDTVAASYDP